MKHLNNDLILMVLIAWEQGVGGATMCIVDRADACGFDMRCLDARGRSTHVRVAFRSAPCATQAAVRKELAALRERSARPRLPLTPVTFLVAVMWSVLAFAWCHRHGVHVLEERAARFLGLHESDVPSSKEFLAFFLAGVFFFSSDPRLSTSTPLQVLHARDRRGERGRGRGRRLPRAPPLRLLRAQLRRLVRRIARRRLPRRPEDARAQAGALPRPHGRLPQVRQARLTTKSSHGH